MIAKTEAFLKDTFTASTYLRSHPADRDYRLEHSYRVANIAKAIAEAEGFNVTYAVIAGLLHDIAYCEEMVSREDRMNHGRRSAAIARPFLESLGLSADAVNAICYGIAIHVDDEADFEWERTPFCETVEMQIISIALMCTVSMNRCNGCSSAKCRWSRRKARWIALLRS